MGFNTDDWEKIRNIYASIFKDIIEDKNLNKHLQDVNEAIIEIEKIISLESGKPTPALENIKNDFYYLKYEILERI